ncbi:MAG: threonylcarbamoyl-AMP synthase [Chloroflexi bacterium]|nr:threonylcarbamoyl-AMP synthase [Chloroflexota bacterium]
METHVLRVDPGEPDRRLIALAAQALRSGQLVAFPTETVYGLGANALDPEAIERIFEVKGRPATNPVIVHLAQAKQLGQVAVGFDASVQALVSRFWPGPLTLVLPKQPQLPSNLTAGLDTIAVRVPEHRVAQALIHAAGVPIGAPSANRSTRPSATKAEHVLDDLAGRIEYVIDGGPAILGLESTVIDMTTPKPRLLRPGALPLERLRSVLPQLQGTWPAAPGSEDAAPSPGLQGKHYAPQAKLILLEGPRHAVLNYLRERFHQEQAEGRRVGLLLCSDDLADLTELAADRFDLGQRGKLGMAAVSLFDGLRQLDSLGVDLILTRSFGENDLGFAITDRLRRGASDVIRVE